MTLRGTRQEPARTAVDVRQCLVTVRNGTHFALPAELVRGLGSTAVPESDQVSAQVPKTDLLAHFPGTSASGRPSREVLCGRQAAQQSVLVDDVIGLTEVGKDQIRPLPAQFTGPERMWFSGLFLFRDTVALLVNPEWLLVQGVRTPRLEPKQIVKDSRTEPRQLESSHGARRSGEETSAASHGEALDGLTLEEATDAEDTPWAEL